MADNPDSSGQASRQFLDIEEMAAERVDEAIHLNLNCSEAICSRILTGDDLVGSIPPGPPTLRGWVGKKLIAAVRRCLFWLTPQIQAFQKDIALAVKEQAGALDEVAGRLSDLELELERLRECTEQHRAEVRAEIAARNQVTPLVYAAAEDHGETPGSMKALNQLESQLAMLEEYGRSTRAELVLAEQRMASVTERTQETLDKVAGAPSRYASSYFNFQAAFRGTFELIKNRVTIYLDLLPSGESGSPKAPFVDLGCGRGEWLSLLRDRNLSAYGVDSNPAMVEFCTQAGLLVQHDDLMMHLRSLPDESRGGFTAFHVAEHLSPGVLEVMLDQFLRVLIPGGIVILETPNPSNLFVGARFHLDPTHQKPIPSDLLRFLCEDRGFDGIQVLPLHPYPEEAMLNIAGDRVAQFIDTHFFGPQDYAVLCKKPHKVLPAQQA
jgi:SAM-dependent methyltransferase